MAAALAAMASGAAAETATVPVVLIGSAGWSTLPNTIVLNATVQLNDSCWSNPRFMPPLAGAKSAPGQTAQIPILADHVTGKMCAQVVRQVKVPTRNWRFYPNPALTSVKFVGSSQPVTVVISKR
jgi:hypothetical protein